MRAVGKGIYIEHVTSWKLEYMTALGGVLETFDTSTEEGPKGIVSISWDADGLGLLSSAKVESVFPPTRDPHTHTARLTLRSLSGEDEVEEVAWEGYYKNFTTGETANGQGATYSLEFGGLQEVIEKGYWYGHVTTFPPNIVELGVNDYHNLLGIPVPDIGKFLEPYETGYKKINKLIKVSEVMEKALESFPDGTWGVDGERRMLLGRPQDGDYNTIDAADIIGLSPTSYEIPPYITESRSDSGTGWNPYGQSRSVSDFTPRVAQDANGSSNDSITTSQGPFWRAAEYRPEPHYISKIDATFTDTGSPIHLTYYPEAEARDGFDGEDFHDLATGGGSTIAEIDLSVLPKTILTVAKSDALYLIADPQAWYDASSLPKDSNSNYEPVEAAFPIDLRILKIPQRLCGEYTGNANSWQVTIDGQVWISESPTYDPDAVGKAGTPIYETIGSKTTGIDPYDPYGGGGVTSNYNQINSMEGAPALTCVYPANSINTIAIMRPIQKTINIAHTQDQLPEKIIFGIESKWFTEDQREDLILKGWTGRFYYHMVFAYTVTIPDQGTQGVSPSYQDPSHPDYPNAGRAIVEFTIQKPFFSQKTQAPPNFAEDLVGYGYPTFVGPNYQGTITGILIPPSKVEGDFYQSTAEPMGDDGERPGKVSIDQYVAGVSCQLKPNDAQTKIRTNTLPYKRFNPYTYNRRYN